MRPAVFIVVLLFLSPAGAQEVSLEKYIEMRVEELDRRVAQEQKNSRIAIQTALMAEIRRQDAERNARFALKVETEELKERVLNVERSRANTYIGIIVIAMLGVINLFKLFWDKR